MDSTEDNISFAAEKLKLWRDAFTRCDIPSWEDLPTIGLYMEQVIALLEECFDYLPSNLKAEQVITPAAINNYVRTGVMPRPEKKRYYRIHIAYLVIICTLKHTLSMSLIRKFVPVDSTEEEVHKIYARFVGYHRSAAEYFSQQASAIASPILDEDPGACTFTVERPGELIMSMAMLCGFSQLLTEQLLKLDYPEGIEPLMKSLD